MTIRMVSGPDLGAGFLWQLSVDREGSEGPEFVYHLQDGGADASGPPIGPPDFLQYRLPTSPCMFGGPRCFERRFRIPEAELPTVRAAYQRTRLAFAALLAHEYEGREVPFSPGLVRFLEACDAPLRAGGIEYRVVGRALGFLEGTGPPPKRLRVETGPGGAELIGGRLEAEMIEPVGGRDATEGFGGRAFLGTFQAGLLVDFGERPAGAGRPEGGTREIPFHGFGVPVATAPAGAG